MPPNPTIIRRSILIGIITAAGLAAQAQVRTLTDQLGRTIKADVIAVSADTVTVKREDGREFELPLAHLSDDDQAWLRDWAKKNPTSAKLAGDTFKTAPSPKSVTLSMNRGKFNVDVTYNSTYSKESYEEWGYNIQLANTTLYPLENLRVDYMIFGRSYAGSSQTRESGRTTVELLGPKKSTTFRTKSFRFNKWRTSDGSYSSQGGLTGVWARLYSGDTLLHEYASPESLKTTEKWLISTD
jgi:hypothetical protein